MNKYILLLTASMWVSLSSCGEDDVSTVGSVEVSFYPVINNGIDSSRYWYLYTTDTNISALQKGYLSKSDENGRVNIKIDNLNAGNYTFKYYNNLIVVNQAVQVTPGSTRKYFLK